jgi:BASS family bile acid:Na+ symporter
MRQTVFQALKVILSVVIPLASLATGLEAATVDPFWLFKRPSLLLRSLLALLILIPSGTVLFLEAIHAPPLLLTGLTVSILAVGVGPPALLTHTRARDKNVAYEVELNVVLMALAVAFIPTAVALLGMYFHVPLRLNVAGVAKVVLTRVLVPLLAGVLVARLFPRLAGPLGRVAAPVVQIALLAVVVVALILTWRSLLAIGARGWITSAAVAFGALVIGHLLGGPEPENRRVLATLGAIRFPGMALLIATITPLGRRVVPVVLAYVLSSLVLVALYDAVTSPRRRRVTAEPPPVSPPPTPARHLG